MAGETGAADAFASQVKPQSGETLETAPVKAAPPPDESTRIEELKYRTQHLELRGKRYQLAIAILGVVTAVLVAATALLGNRSSGQSEELRAKDHQIDALERASASLREQNNTLLGQVDALKEERDAANEEVVEAQSQLEEAQRRLDELGEPSATPAANNNTDGGKTFEFTVPLAQFGTGVDLDLGVVDQNNRDIAYESRSGQRALTPDYGNRLSIDLRVQDPDHAQCKDAVDRRPIAEGASWVPGEVGAQACATSDYGIARLTVTKIAEDGAVTIAEVYWVG
jgi:hypothetical protein